MWGASILGPPLFVIYTKDLDLAIRKSQVQHFADNTNIQNFNSSVKSINRQVDHGLNNLANWLKAKKISLNVSKTELVLFTSLKKQLNSDLKIKVNGRRLYKTVFVKYLGIQTDKKLTREQQINQMAMKLNKANAVIQIKQVLYLTTLKFLDPIMRLP